MIESLFVLIFSLEKEGNLSYWDEVCHSRQQDAGALVTQDPVLVYPKGRHDRVCGP